MYRKIKITAISLIAILYCIIGSSMTFSYFTDESVSTNTFVIGYMNTIGYTASADRLSEPSVTDGAIRTSASGYETYLSETIGDTLTAGENYNLTIYAENAGNIPVYVRFQVLIPKGLIDSGYFAYTLNTEVIGADKEFTGPTTLSCTSTKSQDGITYCEYTFTRNSTLGTSSMTTASPLKSMGLTTDADTTALANEVWAVNHAFNIIVNTNSIQAEGFNSASDAFGSH